MIDTDEPLPPTTCPQSLALTVMGFADADSGRALGEMVGQLVMEIGTDIDLSTLDGITIGVDYDAALAQVDRGFEGLRPLSRSNTQEMRGVAMSPAVMRDGHVLTHLVFDAGPLTVLIWRDEFETEDEALEAKMTAIGIVAHECAHVQITAEKERLIPEARLGTPIEGFQRAVMFQIAEVLWDEYAACRLSAWYAPRQNIQHAETVAACASVARERCKDAIIAYRDHGELEKLVGEAGPPLCQPIKATAYLLGGMDGAEEEWEAFAEARQALESAGYGELVDNLHAELRRLWNTRDTWAPDLSTFGGLEEIATKIFDSAGIYFETTADGGCYIDVPFTPETIPTE